jgi:hypothetical protein
MESTESSTCQQRQFNKMQLKSVKAASSQCMPSIGSSTPAQVCELSINASEMQFQVAKSNSIFILAKAFQVCESSFKATHAGCSSTIPAKCSTFKQRQLNVSEMLHKLANAA